MTTDTGSADGLEVALEEREAWKRRLTITVSSERVARARRRELRKLRETVKLKGFRKGKVPPRVIEERYGPLVEERTVNALVSEAYREALEDHRLQPVGEPSFGDVRYDPGESLTFQVELEVMPDIRLQRVGGFKIERPRFSVEDEEVRDVVEKLREDRAVWEPVERSPEDGDLVSVRIARLPGDGEAPAGGGEGAAVEGAAAGGADPEAAAGAPEGPATVGDEAAGEPEGRPYRFELGAGYAIPDVEASIKRLAPGTAEEFDVAFPEDFDDEEMAGRTQRLRIELVEVKSKRLPAVDDQFAADVGDFETLDALRDAVRADLEQHKEREARQATRDRIVESVIEANPFEVPPAMVDRYLDRVIEAPEDVDPEELQEARRSFRPAAERQIKRHLILEHLIEREGLEATEEELEDRVRELADRRDVKPAEVRRRLAREQGLDSLRRQIAVDKVFAYLESQSEVA